MPAAVDRHPDQQLRPDPDRVIGRLFLPSAEPPHVHRAQDLIRRLLELDEATVSRMLPVVMRTFGPHHPDLSRLLRAHAAMIAPAGEPLSEAQALLLGAAFTAEYAVEGAALCNPSVVPHPDQDGLEADELRVAVSLRGIGEGHISALEFTTAVVTGTEWRFNPRDRGPIAGHVSSAPIDRELLGELIQAGREPDELTLAVLNALPQQVLGVDIEQVLADMSPDLLLHPEAYQRVAALRRWAGSGYTVSYPRSTSLDRRVLLPSTEDESHGLEDARFTRFVDDDGTTSYRACYTAYDGRSIGNRLLSSPDLRTFTSHRLTGLGARNKGMALFPRRIDGRLAALSRANGTTIGLTLSDDGYRWEQPVDIEGPRNPWQILQVGNGSPPLETDRGWLVITHGVGLMRAYSLSAILLDLDDPTKVVGRLPEPLLPPTTHAGYVPNVVFSCGAVIHRGRVFIPYGIGDATIAVASLDVEDLLDDLVTAGP